MWKHKKASPVTLTDTTLDFNLPSDYSIKATPNGKIMIGVDGGKTTVLSSSEFAAITTFDLPAGSTLKIDASLLVGREVDGTGQLHITGLSFTEADAAVDFNFEPSVNLDTFIFDLLEDRGVSGAIDALTVNGTKDDAFKLVWDHLDDNYTYYNTHVNTAFIDLGIEYAHYLQQGGEFFTDTVVKFEPDNADADTAPERLQSLHDNLLGNLFEAGIADKFGAGAGAIYAKIQAAGLGDFLGVIGNLSDGRAWYGGYDYQDPTATIAFDEAFFDRADDHDDHICHDHHHGFSGNNSHYDWDFA